MAKEPKYIGAMFRQLIQRASERLPSQCAVCRSWPALPICEDCMVAFAQPIPRCQTCALAITSFARQCGACLISPPPLDACFAAVSYGYPWSDLIADFKLHQHPAWALSFARILRASPWVEPALDAADWIIPIPLSSQRLQERGYNQAFELARALDASKASHHLLHRVMDTAPQKTQSRAQRKNAVQHAFGVNSAMIHHVLQRRVVLIDDVMTTGATIYAAANVLRQAGAAHVTAVVLARTE